MSKKRIRVLTRFLEITGGAAVFVMLGLWLWFVSIPFIYANSNKAESVARVMFPDGILRCPCVNGEFLIYPEEINSELVRFSVRGFSKSSLVKIDTNPFNIDSCGVSNSENVISWSLMERVGDGGQSVYQVKIISLANGAEKEVMIKTHHEILFASLMRNGIVVRWRYFDDRKRQYVDGIGYYDLLGNTYSSIRADLLEKSQIVGVNGEWVITDDLDVLMLTSVITKQSYIIESFHNQEHKFASLYKGTLVYLKTSLSGVNTIVIYDIDSRSVTGTIPLDSEYELTYLAISEYGIVSKVRRSSGDGGAIKVLLSDVYGDNQEVVAIGDGFHCPVVHGDYLYWENSLYNPLGKMVDFSSWTGLDLWRPYHWSVSTARQSYIFRKEMH